MQPANRTCSFVVQLLAGMGLALTAAPRAAAQCTTPWLPGDGVPGTNQEVSATTMWDPDGPGPVPPRLVLGGYFVLAGATPANRIATYDPATGAWGALGAGMSGGVGYTQVYALATLPNGDLVAAGQFTSAGGVAANQIARWNGTAWSALGSGLSGGASTYGANVRALVTLPNGDLVAGGEFTFAGGVSANSIARWDGTTWSPLGSGVGMPGFPAFVYALATLPNGDLVAGGNFTTAGGVTANGLARWNGTAWSAFGSGLASSYTTLTTMPNGDLVAGAFQSIERWNGTTWSTLAAAMPGYVKSLTALPNGDLIAGGDFLSIAGVSANRIARWNGAAWSPLGPGIVHPAPSAAVLTMTTLPNGDLVAAGSFQNVGTLNASYLARWNGAAWSALAAGTNSAVLALTRLPNGDLVAGGWFSSIGGVSANAIARWNGVAWSALGTGMSSTWPPLPRVTAIAALPNGDLVAGGEFAVAGGVAANRIARWNGTTWSPLGSGTNGEVLAVIALPNGDLVAGGAFGSAGGVFTGSVARWNGTAWSALGPGLNGRVFALATLANGDLVAGGDFTVAGGLSVPSLARWNGTNWSTVGSGIGPGGLGWSNPVYALATRPNGNLVAGGAFSLAGGATANYLAEWNGATWSGLGLLPTGTSYPRVSALTSLPNGDLLAGGHGFTLPGGIDANGIARWNDVTWSALGAGTDGIVLALTAVPNGDVMVGGTFATAGGLAAAWLARLTTTCPATAVVNGAGCTGSGGPNLLTATSLPWTGAVFRSIATGMPANSLAIGVRGLATASTPLASILPQGVAGCLLLVSPDLLDFHVPAGPSLPTQFAIPNTTVLAGRVLHQQVVPIELDALGNITALTSTNALTLTIGSF